MTKTQAQIEADQKLTEAIEESIKAYGGETSFVLGDYTVLTSVQTLTDEGVLITRYPIFLRDGDLPWYRILGLLEMAKLQAAQQATNQNDNG